MTTEKPTRKEIEADIENRSRQMQADVAAWIEDGRPHAVVRNEKAPSGKARYLVPIIVRGEFRMNLVFDSPRWIAKLAARLVERSEIASTTRGGSWL